MGCFLFSRFSNGTLLYYINERFTSLTLVAVVGLFIVGISYLFGQPHGDHHHHHQHDHGADEHHDHNHDVTWVGIALLLLPVLLGLFVTPRPLGASAMANREVGFESRSVMPAAVAASTEKSSTERNILDWVYAFHQHGEGSFEGEAVDTIGFVYTDDEMVAEEFALTRYVVSCCAADASYVSLVVRSAEPHSFSNDQWVRVQGKIKLLDSKRGLRTVIIPTKVESVSIPIQPYLYP